MNSATVKVDYSIRPAKHIERKLMINMLNNLKEAGYRISNYTYIGFGSIFYIDFVLFHKFLGIRDMICFEKKDILKRLEFNKPYDFIEIKKGDFSDQYHTLEFGKQVLLWLDYEDPLTEEKANDLGDIVQNKILNGSIVILTLHIDLRGDDEQKNIYINNFLGLLEKYNPTLRKNDITSKNIGEIITKILQKKLDDIFVDRKDLGYRILFNYSYKDGARMMTIGFIFDEETKLSNIGIDLDQSKLSKPSYIDIPILTNRERYYIDSHIQEILEQKGNNKLELPFEIKEREVNDYILYYKEYPSFAEISY